MTDHIALANAALEKRGALLNTFNSGGKLTGEQMEEIDRLGKEAEGYIRSAEREIENRDLVERAAKLSGTGGSSRTEWRALIPSRNEWRAALNTGTPSEGGYTVPTKVAETAINALTAESVFLRGLPETNIHRLESEHFGEFKMPIVLSEDDPAYVAEGDTIPHVDTAFGSKTLKPVKIAEIMVCTAEILQDSQINLRQLLADQAIRKTAEKADRGLFTGTGADEELTGIMGQGTVTTLGAGEKINHDVIADLMAAIESTNGRPSVIWCGPGVASQLRKERYAADGQYVRGGPMSTDNGGAWSTPILVSATVPAKTMIVADASRLHVLIRKQIQMVESSEYLFAQDKIAFKTTFRMAGAALAEATSVQIVKEA